MGAQLIYCILSMAEPIPLQIYNWFQFRVFFLLVWLPYQSLALLAGAVEYTDCISAKEYDPPTECPRYDIKQFDDEAPVMLGALGNAEYPFVAIAPRSLLARSSST